MFKPKIWSERFLETSNGHGIRGFAPSGAQYFTPVAQFFTFLFSPGLCVCFHLCFSQFLDFLLSSWSAYILFMKHNKAQLERRRLRTLRCTEAIFLEPTPRQCVACPTYTQEREERGVTDKLTVIHLAKKSAAFC